MTIKEIIQELESYGIINDIQLLYTKVHDNDPITVISRKNNLYEEIYDNILLKEEILNDYNKDFKEALLSFTQKNIT